MSNNDDVTRSTNDSASEDYAESSKIGTVGGGTAGALTGAAMGAVAGPVGAVIGGMAGALVGGTGGAVGDTLGEKAEDAVTGDEDGTMTSRGATRMGDTDASYTGVTAQDVTYGAGADTSYSNVNTSNMPVESLEATNDTASMVLPVVEEEIRIGKREVETGGVRLTSSISETPVSEQVSLHEERVTVERRPLDQALDASTLEAALQDATFEVRESAEEVVVQKDARIVEEVVVGKTASERTETIQDSIRRTDVQIEELPATTRTVSSSSSTTSSSSSGLFGDHGSSTTTTTSSDDLGTTTTADDYTDTSTTTASTGEQQGGGLFSRLGNALERLTGVDINRDGDVGKPGSRKK